MSRILVLTAILLSLANVQGLRLPALQRNLASSVQQQRLQTQLQFSRQSTTASVFDTGLKATTNKSSQQSLQKTLNDATNLFPVWVLASSILGWFKPALFDWFTPFVTPSLAFTMLSMGMTLTLADFKRVAQTPKWVLIGFLAQFSIMPLAAAFFAKLAKLGPDLASGLILVGCAPGGTASNLVALIAGADVALSVLMTMASTIAAIVMTPLLTAKLAGGYVQIKAAELVMSTLNVVLLPVAAGLALNTVKPKLSQAIASYTPFLGVLLVSAICGCISAANSGTALRTIGPSLVAAIVGLHSVGFALGYSFSKVLGADESRARTISIETGMQNSALAVVLSKHFPNPVLSSLPGAFSATAHSVLGSILAAYWRANKGTQAEQGSKYAVSKRYW